MIDNNVELEKKEEPAPPPEQMPPPPPPPPVVGVEAPPPPPGEIYNPFVERSAPVDVGHSTLPSTLIPSSLKRRMAEGKPKPAVSTAMNPFASSLPAPPKPDVEVEADMSVPGPQLRFSLVPYGMDASEDEKPPAPSKEDKKPPAPSKEDDAFAQFMNDIATLLTVFKQTQQTS